MRNQSGSDVALKSDGCGEVRFLNCVHAARDELRQLMQRWDNRLTLQGLVLGEEYRNGRLSLALNLKFTGHAADQVYYT